MPGETPISNQGGLETIGLAVFRGDRLVGELNSIETLSHLITTNNLETATISVPSPFSYGETIALSISQESRTRNSVEFVNSFPFIRSHSSISASILSLDPNTDYTSNQNLELIEEAVRLFLEEHIRSYLYRTSLDLRSDIVRFWQICKKKAPNYPANGNPQTGLAIIKIASSI